MQRCFDLAQLGAGRVAPNPMVGAVLVYQGRIIGEGWHRQYGGPHAEVNAVADVRQEDRRFISKSTLYISLEPCCIFGKTPPCTDLILRNEIKKVVVSCMDQTPEVKGKGVAILRQAGVEVVTGVLAMEGKVISAVRNTFTHLNRPFIQLKFAKTRNGFMGKKGEQVWISNLFSKRLAHKVRAEFGAIMVGTNTAITDSPQLTNRLWYGDSPLRIVLDRNLTIKPDNGVMGPSANTWVITEKDAPVQQSSNVRFYKMKFDNMLIKNVLQTLAEERVTSLIVEGGAFTLNQFVQKGLWDEAWVFTGKRMVKDGIPAPNIFGEVVGSWPIADDVLTILSNPEAQPLNFH